MAAKSGAYLPAPVYAPRPTLSFPALPKIIAFPLSEAQAAVLAQVYSERLQLRAAYEMEKRETDFDSWR